MTAQEVIEKCSHIPSSVYESEQEMWFDLISKLDNPIIVDFGTGWGKSASSLGLSNSDAKVYTFDNGLPHLNAQRSKRKYIQEVLNYIQKSGAKNIVFQLGSSLEVPWHKPIDVLNIDSDHTYETTKAEIERWLPFVKIGGYIFFHDYEHPRCPGVRQAIDELSNKYKLKLERVTDAGAVKCAHYIKEI